MVMPSVTSSCDGFSMANPFPGMDPYLEGDLWITVHTDLCAEIARQLAPKLRPKYVALSTRRVVLASPDDTELSDSHRFPDIGVLTSSPSPPANGGSVATAPLVLSADLPEPIPHVSVEIRDLAERRLVTCIEVLMPTNKRGSGREEYAIKRFQILSGSAHLLEIDLVRVGVRFPTLEPLPAVPYFVFLSRAGRRGVVEAWPIALDQPLPPVKVPLLPGDDDVDLDLQQALTIIYDIFGYDDLINYGEAPPGTLTVEQKEWVEERLRQSGRRP
jgi:hypothetical protein